MAMLNNQRVYISALDMFGRHRSWIWSGPYPEHVLHLVPGAQTKSNETVNAV
jgi:hypothetical protein